MARVQLRGRRENVYDFMSERGTAAARPRRVEEDRKRSIRILEESVSDGSRGHSQSVLKVLQSLALSVCGIRYA